MPDNYGEALKYLRAAESFSTETPVEASLMSAQVHATLAVADQLRDANVISLFLAEVENLSTPEQRDFGEIACNRMVDEDTKVFIDLKVKPESWVY